MKPSTRREIFALPMADRAQLAHEILDSLVADNEPPGLTPAQETEVRRRIRAQRRNPAASVPWETVRAELDQKYK
jgi:putative addiction module component (TIGR02574 family)